MLDADRRSVSCDAWQRASARDPARSPEGKYDLQRRHPVAHGLCLAQETPGSTPAVSAKATSDPWAFVLTTSGYIVPGGQSLVSPDFTADRGWLHLEARYNYEALETGSLWVGYDFSAGKKLVLDVTPMVGGVFGNLNGVAPG